MEKRFPRLSKAYQRYVYAASAEKNNLNIWRGCRNHVHGVFKMPWLECPILPNWFKQSETVKCMWCCVDESKVTLRLFCRLLLILRQTPCFLLSCPLGLGAFAIEIKGG